MKRVSLVIGALLSMTVRMVFSGITTWCIQGRTQENKYTLRVMRNIASLNTGKGPQGKMTTNNQS
jgi:hypothetical protein